MRIRKLGLLLPLLWGSLARGQAIMEGLILEGSSGEIIMVPGYDPDLTQDGQSERVVWPMLDRGPVTDVRSSEIACNKLDGSPPHLTITVKAGSTITFKWDDWPRAAKGPTMTYLAFCDGDCPSKDPTKLGFFKIDESGVNADGTWASEALLHDGGYSITMPSDIKPGNYLLRHEFVSLHNAHILGGAEFFPVCANIRISGSGSVQPTDVVRFPGTYDSMESGIFINVNKLIDPLSYKIPGPRLIAGLFNQPSIDSKRNRISGGQLKLGSANSDLSAFTSFINTDQKTCKAAYKACINEYKKCIKQFSTINHGCEAYKSEVCTPHKSVCEDLAIKQASWRWWEGRFGRN